MEKQPKKELVVYRTYNFTYRGVEYCCSPINTAIVYCTEEPEYSYVMVFSGKHDLQGEPIFNEYLIDWLMGNSRDKNRYTIWHHMGWVLGADNIVYQDYAMEDDKELKLVYDTWDLRNEP